MKNQNCIGLIFFRHEIIYLFGELAEVEERSLLKIIDAQLSADI
jgi:hypothetical protein